MTNTTTPETFRFGRSEYRVERTVADNGQPLAILHGPRGAQYGLLPFPKRPDLYYAINARSLASFDRTPFYGHTFRLGATITCGYGSAWADA